jgi:methionyl-tRNA formyltransferase
MKLVFMGSDPVALPLLNFLFDERPHGCRLEAVFTQPDRRAGRGMHLRPNAIKQWALDRGLEVRQPVRCGQEEADFLRTSGVDLVLVMAYGQILPRCILEATPNKVMNVHASLLPRLRGASPIHTAVALGLEETGVSLMEVIPKLDAGPVAGRERVEIRPDDGIGKILEKVSLATVPLVRRGLDQLVEGTLSFEEQDPARVTYCRILEKTDQHLDFRVSASDLLNRVRAFQPWPGAAIPWGDAEIRIHEASVDEASSRGIAPGTVQRDAESLRIACGRGWLRPLVLQRPGGKPLPVEDFFRGFPLEDGTVLPGREMRPLEADRPFPYRKK